MAHITFVQSSTMPAPVQAVFAWHKRPGAFERLNPPWEKVQVIERRGGIAPGGSVTLKTYIGPIPSYWQVDHVETYQEDKIFSDRQRKGPFADWLHQHQFEPISESTSRLTDYIEYKLPFGLLGKLFGKPFVQDKLTRLFQYRHRVTQNDMQMYQRYHQPGGTPMKILVSGSTGFVGESLVSFLETQGEDVFRLVRRPAKTDHEIQWDPANRKIESAKLEGMDAVIHLAGENIVGRWTEAKKQAIFNSRQQGTQFLSETLAGLSQPPKVLVSASAIGYYGDRGDTVQTEGSPPAQDFLAKTAQAWEAATDPAKAKGIRTVNARLGLVLSPKGGALQKMLPPFLLGGGGPLGNGQQYMSWVALDDVIGALYHAVKTDSISGPMNVVAPEPVPNSVFTKALGKVLFRPTLFPVPSFAIKLLFGEMGEALFLSSTRVEPKVLKDSGYRFLFPNIEGAFRHLLGK